MINGSVPGSIDFEVMYCTDNQKCQYGKCGNVAVLYAQPVPHPIGSFCCESHISLMYGDFYNWAYRKFNRTV